MKDIIKISFGKNHGASNLLIKRAEELLGKKLPEQYKELLKITNGCEIGEWVIFPIKDPKNIKKTWDDVVYNNKNKPFHISSELTIFAENGTGDYLCFKSSNENQLSDSIYYWNHETGDQEVIAENLRNFIIENDE